MGDFVGLLVASYWWRDEEKLTTDLTGGAEARAEGAAPDAAALHIEVDQEPGAVLWAKVAAV